MTNTTPTQAVKTPTTHDDPFNVPRPSILTAAFNQFHQPGPFQSPVSGAGQPYQLQLVSQHYIPQPIQTQPHQSRSDQPRPPMIGQPGVPHIYTTAAVTDSRDNVLYTISSGMPVRGRPAVTRPNTGERWLCCRCTRRCVKVLFWISIALKIAAIIVTIVMVYLRDGAPVDTETPSTSPPPS